MFCNTSNVTTLYKAENFEQLIRFLTDDGAVHTVTSRRDLVINVCSQLYDVHLVGLLKIQLLPLILRKTGG